MGLGIEQSMPDFFLFPGARYVFGLVNFHKFCRLKTFYLHIFSQGSLASPEIVFHLCASLSPLPI